VPQAVLVLAGMGLFSARSTIQPHAGGIQWRSRANEVNTRSNLPAGEAAAAQIPGIGLKYGVGHGLKQVHVWPRHTQAWTAWS